MKEIKSARREEGWRQGEKEAKKERNDVEINQGKEECESEIKTGWREE